MVGDDVYGGTFRYLERVRRHAGVDCPLRRTWQPDPDALWESLTARTALVWFESPSNPLLKIIDIAAAADDRARAGRAGG